MEPIEAGKIFRITRLYEWDAGHRVPQHKSKCKSPHGHRYSGEFTFEGQLVKESGSDEGMVLDFGDAKAIIAEFIDGQLDHGYMGQNIQDEIVLKCFEGQGFKVHRVDFPPTAENIADYLLTVLTPKFEDRYGTGLKLVQVKVWETPNCVALAGKV